MFIRAIAVTNGLLRIVESYVDLSESQEAGASNRLYLISQAEAIGRWGACPMPEGGPYGGCLRPAAPTTGYGKRGTSVLIVVVGYSDQCRAASRNAAPSARFW